jgi:hypothetical protein
MTSKKHKKTLMEPTNISALCILNTNVYLIAVLRSVQRCDKLVIIVGLAACSEANVIKRSIAGESIAQLNADDEKRHQTNDQLREERH